jgi:ATP-dependent Lhr-like helicase
VDGKLALYVERGGRTILSYVDGQAELAASARALAGAVRSGALGPMSVEKADGETIRSTPLAEALAAAGFRTTPRGLRLRA